MITKENYYKLIKDIDFAQFSDDIREAKEFTDEATNHGRDWSMYNSNKDFRETIDAYFQALSKVISKSGEKKSEQSRLKQTITAKSEPAVKKIAKPGKTTLPKPQKAKPPSKTPLRQKIDRAAIDYSKAKTIEALPLELKFVARYLNMVGKPKTRNHVRLFINALQKAIREKAIRKTSPYAKEIMKIQENLIAFHSQFKNDTDLIAVTMTEANKAPYLKLLGKLIELPSVILIKSYINLQGRIVTNKQANALLSRIEGFIKKGKVNKRDQYWDEVAEIMDDLQTFIQKNPNHGILKISTRTLNGLEAIAGCKCETGINGIDMIPDDYVMSSMDIANLNFPTLGFTGEWLEFLGDPAPNFTLMIYGEPKFGKSTLAIKLAAYLARNHGTVLYVAKEEGIGMTLREKLEDPEVKHPDLYAVGSLPSDLYPYDFIFLDSVNKLGLTPEDIDDLREQYPQKGFIAIFQTTKGGKFRGSQEFQHDVDSIVQVPELGKAIQYGRYNAGGEMDIFNS